MTLTIDQLCVLKDGVRFALERYEAHAEIQPEPKLKAYWAGEAATAAALLGALKDAIRVDVEGGSL